MRKLGLCGYFVEAVMRGVRIVSFSVLFNGGCTSEFILSRGIRQGDPICPASFYLQSRASLVWCRMPIVLGILKVFSFSLHLLHRKLTCCFLRMIAYSSARQLRRRPRHWTRFCSLTVKLLAIASIMKNPQFSLVKSVLKQ